MCGICGQEKSEINTSWKWFPNPKIANERGFRGLKTSVLYFSKAGAATAQKPEKLQL
jgi:hypothetical protein